MPPVSGNATGASYPRLPTLSLQSVGTEKHLAGHPGAPRTIVPEQEVQNDTQRAVGARGVSRVNRVESHAARFTNRLGLAARVAGPRVARERQSATQYSQDEFEG